MLILRRISGNGVQMNDGIGDGKTFDNVSFK